MPMRDSEPDAWTLNEVGQIVLLQVKFRDIRAAVQELHDASRADLEQARSAWRSNLSLAGSAQSLSVAEGLFIEMMDRAMAERAEELAETAAAARLPTVGQVIRAAGWWGLTAIFGIMLDAVGGHEVAHLMGWDPPPAAVVRQMTHRQMDELARQIERQLEEHARGAAGTGARRGQPRRKAPGRREH